MFKIWNIILIIIAYWLTLFGTFLVRSGIIASVHAFPNTGLGIWFATFMFAMLAWAIFLLVTRINDLKSKKEIETTISKESSFLLANILFLAVTFVVFWGTIFPLTSQLFTGVKTALNADYFNSVANPVMLAGIALMGICVLIPWRKASLNSLVKGFAIPFALALVTAAYLVYSGRTRPLELVGFSIVVFVVFSTFSEFIRGLFARRAITGEGLITALGSMLVTNRRRYGGYIVHLGIFMMALGVLGQTNKVEHTITMNPGETANVAGYNITFNGLQQTMEGRNEVISTNLAITRNNQPLGIVTPKVIAYPNQESPHSEVDFKSTPKEDFYVMIGGSDDGVNATFKITINPFIWWLWIGGYVIVLGTILALWPRRGKSEMVMQ